MEPRDEIQDSADDATTSSVWPLRLLLIFGTFAVAPVIYGLGWCLRYIFPGHKAERFWDQWVMGNFFSHGVLFLIWLSVCALVSSIIIVVSMVRAHTDDDTDYRMHKPKTYRKTDWSTFIVAFLAFVVALVSFVQFIRVAHNNTIDPDRYYGRSTVAYVEQLDAAHAPSLSRLLPGMLQSTDPRCDLVGPPGLPSCVKQGTLSTDGWDERVSSLNGASNALTRTTGDLQNVSLDTNTVTYLNTWNGQPARWSGVLNGKGNGTGLGGVAEWDGSKATTCTFSGAYAIGRSFGGSGLSDLDDMLEASYPALHYNIKDVWGYCDGTQPIVVIPMLRQMYWANRTVDTFGGIVKVQGRNGDTVLTYQASAKPGEYPGPIYPASLVDIQVDQFSWADGRRAHDDFGFGYEVAQSDVQAGNVSDYLLRNKATGELEWVTPLTLRNSSSQLFVAYAVSQANKAADGQLNQLSIYVLGPTDPRQVNIDNMEAQARAWFAQQVPGFISSGGKLLEFTPVGGNIWRAYGEVSGRVQYLLDFDATNSLTPKLTNVSPTTTPTGPKLDCNDPSKLTTAQIANCIEQLSHYLAQNAGTPSK